MNSPFLDEIGFKEEHEKYWLFKTTSWATSGAFRLLKSAEDTHVSDLSYLKVITGYKAKRILELGRAKVLQEK